ncbi:PREDICTED: uncharacterized protein LOC104799169 [Tarenaya hassleriana]|uniref:uncharacterized protein LOC104799169 n=1 Tax=Tarenaya hassleriana TaxID=28532 RepID=UPI0008FD8E68|nr:PREDICTED: uncharacterized protein LOC104799169 [Tarenaya hassleriana]
MAGKTRIPETLDGRFTIIIFMAMTMMTMVTHGQGFKLEVKNELTGRYRRLVYQCWSKDDDLGWRMNWPGQVKDWSFSMSVFSTYFYCNFRTGYGRADKQLVAAWDMKEECGDRQKCTWVAKKEGLFLRRWKTRFLSNKYGTERWPEYEQRDTLQRHWSQQ